MTADGGGQQNRATSVGSSWLRVHRPGTADTLVQLIVGTPRLTIGRDPSADIPLAEDPEASRLHAVIELIAAQWTVVDQGLSTNGTFVNGERVFGRRRLCGGDIISIGCARLMFEGTETGTRTSEKSGEQLQLTQAQESVLRELCRPFTANRKFASATTNRDIAMALGVTVDTVSHHLQTLYEKFDIADLPQNQKRAALVNKAMRVGFAEILGL